MICEPAAMAPYRRSQSGLLKSGAGRSDVRLVDVWLSLRYVSWCLALSLLKLWDLNPVSLALRRWRQLHHLNTLMTINIRPRMMDLASDFFLSDYRRRRKLLWWVKASLPGLVVSDLGDFSDCWQDGIVFCALMEALSPGACPRYGQLRPHHRVNNCRLGLQLARQYLQVEQLPLSPEEMAIADEGTEAKICNLVQLLKWRHQQQGRQPAVMPVTSCEEAVPCRCQVRGTGIRAGIVGRRAKFNILTEAVSKLDLDIEIRGPNNEYNKEKIVIVNTEPSFSRQPHPLIRAYSKGEDDGKLKIIEDGAGHSFLRQKSMDEDPHQLVIPFDYQCVGEGRFLVTYIPRTAGFHYITVLSEGQHIQGSPFEVKVSDWVSSWNLVPKPRVVPFDMLRGEHKDELTPAAATDVVKQKLSHVAHMSNKLTKMRRRVLRKVVTPGGLQILCDVTSAPARLKDGYEDLSVEGTEEMDSSTTDFRIPSFKYTHSEVKMSEGLSLDDIIRQSLATPRKAELQMNRNKSEPPEIVVTEYRDDVDDVFCDGDRALGLAGSDCDMSPAFRRASKLSFSIPRVIVSSPVSSPRRDFICTSFNEEDLESGRRMYANDLVAPSPLSSRASSVDTSPSSNCRSPSPHVSDIVESVLDILALDRHCHSAITPRDEMPRDSVDALSQQGQITNSQENISAISTNKLSPLTSCSKARPSLSTAVNLNSGCREHEAPPLLYDPQVQLTDSSLPYVSSFKEECQMSDLDVHMKREETIEFAQTDHVSHTLVRQTLDILLGELHDDSYSETCCAGSVIHEKKLNAGSRRGLDKGEKEAIRAIFDLQTSPVQKSQKILTTLPSSQVSEQETFENTTCNINNSGRRGRVSDVISGSKADQIRPDVTSLSCDSAELHSKNKMARSLRGNMAREQLLKKSYSFPARTESIDGAGFPQGSPTFDASMKYFDETEQDLSCSGSEEDIGEEANPEEMDDSQFKINILSCGGSHKSYFYCKTGLSDNCQGRKVCLSGSMSASSKDQIAGNKKLSRKDQVLQRLKTSLHNQVSASAECVNWDDFDGQCGSPVEREDLRMTHIGAILDDPFLEEEEEILQVVIETRGKLPEAKNRFLHNQGRKSSEALPMDVRLEEELSTLDVGHSLSPLQVDDKHSQGSLGCPHILGEVAVLAVKPDQREDTLGASPLSDSSNKSGNSDWSDFEVTTNERSANQNSAKTSMYLLEGDWSPQFVEFDYNGGGKSRRSSAEKMCSLTINNSSQSVSGDPVDVVGTVHEHGDSVVCVTAKHEHGDEFRNSASDKNKNENKQQFSKFSGTLSCRENKQDQSVSGTYLENKPDQSVRGSYLENKQDQSVRGNYLENAITKQIECHQNDTSIQSSAHNFDKNNRNLDVNVVSIGDGVPRVEDCSLYLKRRRKPVYAHEISTGGQLCEVHSTRNTSYEHSLKVNPFKSNTNFYPIHLKENTDKSNASFSYTPKCCSFSEHEMTSSGCPHSIPVNEAPSLGAKCPNRLQSCHTSCQLERNIRLHCEDVITDGSPTNDFPTRVEYFQEHTLTPSKYRHQMPQLRTFDNIPRSEDGQHSAFQETSSTVASGASRVHSKGWPHNGGETTNLTFVPDSGLMKVLLSPGDRCLTPTKFRRCVRNHGNGADRPCEIHSSGRDFEQAALVGARKEDHVYGRGSLWTGVGPMNVFQRHVGCIDDRLASTGRSWARDACPSCQHHSEAIPYSGDWKLENGHIKGHDSFCDVGYRHEKLRNHSQCDFNSCRNCVSNFQDPSNGGNDRSFYGTASKKWVNTDRTPPYIEQQISNRNCARCVSKNNQSEWRCQDCGLEYINGGNRNIRFAYNPGTPIGLLSGSLQAHAGQHNLRSCRDCSSQLREGEQPTPQLQAPRSLQQQHLRHRHTDGSLGQHIPQHHPQGQHIPPHLQQGQHIPPHLQQEQHIQPHLQQWQRGDCNVENGQRGSYTRNQTDAQRSMTSGEMMQHYDRHLALQQMQQQTHQIHMPNFSQKEFHEKSQKDVHHLQQHQGVHHLQHDQGVHHLQHDQGVHHLQHDQGVHHLQHDQGVHHLHQNQGVHHLQQNQGVHHLQHDQDVHHLQQHQGVHHLQQNQGVHHLQHDQCVPYHIQQHNDVPHLQHDQGVHHLQQDQGVHHLNDHQTVQPQDRQHQEDLQQTQPPVQLLPQTSTPYDLQGSHMTSLRRQSTVETMDSGITEVDSYNSNDVDYDNSIEDPEEEMPVFGDSFELQLFSALS